MAVPRPVLLALLGLGLVASLFLVTRSGTNESVSSPAKAGQARHPAPAGKAPAPASPRPLVKPAKLAPKPAKPKPYAGVPARVQAAANALGEGKVVVFFFSKPGPADDVGARTAVSSLRGMDRVAIFEAGLDEVAAFRPMLSNLGISQVPATVIVRPGKKAVLLQGFVDAGTLRQNVADALR